MCAQATYPIIGIFHPHCDQRAGGEKVLWTLLDVLLQRAELAEARFVIYTNRPPAADAAAGDVDDEEVGRSILSAAATTFGMVSLITHGRKSSTASLSSSSSLDEANSRRPRISFVFLRHSDMLDPVPL